MRAALTTNASGAVSVRFREQSIDGSLERAVVLRAYQRYLGAGRSDDHGVRCAGNAGIEPVEVFFVDFVLELAAGQAFVECHRVKSDILGYIRKLFLVE